MRSTGSKKLAELIKDIKIAMLTTVDDKGEFRSRPMVTTEMKEDGVIYFFTYNHTPKTDEMDKHHKVNINYMDSDSKVYLSVSGDATLIKDQEKMNKLWNPYLKIWFPNGKSDPNLFLLKIKIHKAEYWDQIGDRMVQLKNLTERVSSEK